MVLKKPIVRLKHRKLNRLDVLPDIGESEATLHLHFHYAIFSIDERTVVSEEHWLNRIETSERTSFEILDIATVRSSAFRIQN